MRNFPYQVTQDWKADNTECWPRGNHRSLTAAGVGGGRVLTSCWENRQYQSLKMPPFCQKNPHKCTELCIGEAHCTLGTGSDTNAPMGTSTERLPGADNQLARPAAPTEWAHWVLGKSQSGCTNIHTAHIPSKESAVRLRYEAAGKLTQQGPTWMFKVYTHTLKI